MRATASTRSSSVRALPPVLIVAWVTVHKGCVNGLLVMDCKAFMFSQLQSCIPVTGLCVGSSFTTGRTNRATAMAGRLVRIAGLVFLLIAAAIIFLFLLFGGFIVN
jgi:hypothetical protein